MVGGTQFKVSRLEVNTGFTVLQDAFGAQLAFITLVDSNSYRARKSRMQLPRWESSGKQAAAGVRTLLGDAAIFELKY